jgi:hypothetical protein
VVVAGGGGGCTVEAGGGCTVDEAGGSRVVVDVANAVAVDGTLELAVRVVGGNRSSGRLRTRCGIPIVATLAPLTLPAGASCTATADGEFAGDLAARPTANAATAPARNTARITKVCRNERRLTPSPLSVPSLTLGMASAPELSTVSGQVSCAPPVRSAILARGDAECWRRLGFATPGYDHSSPVLYLAHRSGCRAPGGTQR